MRNNDRPVVWISAGEASGDLHGALLMKAFRKFAPNLQFTGMGGSAMAEAGFEARYPMELINTVGLTEVLSALPRILRTIKNIKRDLAEVRPDALVLIDCPDFNFRLLKTAFELDIPVYYYISPQIWAWRSGRVNILRKYVRKVLCILPFEKDFYARQGMEADYVGSPLLDQLPLNELAGIERDPLKVGILPGSRGSEVKKLAPVFAGAAGLLKQCVPGVKFSLVLAPHMTRERVMEHFKAPKGIETPEVEFVESADRYQAIKSCALTMCASGTVTLETALIGTPFLLSYKLSPLSWLFTFLVNVEYAGLPNLILGREAFPEMIQSKANPEDIAARAQSWLTDPEALSQVHDDLARIRTMVGEPGAPERAAKIILNDLNGG